MPSSSGGSPVGGSTAPSGSASGSSSGSGNQFPFNPNPSSSGFELESGSSIDAHTIFVVPNGGNYSSSTTVTEPISATQTDDDVVYVTTGSSTTTLAITATEFLGAWTYSEIYTYDLTVTITGSDGSVVTDLGWLNYTFIAAGDATVSGFSFVGSSDYLGGGGGLEGISLVE